ncbi:GNAT family N-acetyltransferase [Hyalangium versicolor]|uniref:GNAT family N-acetyltransferase n=1 Tax=Hyalangium versicolor TaxID=2861190 RepID=UPI001CCB8039|nr:GNAT family N-acetyltransferase [Hyalangium versicolor]
MKVLDTERLVIRRLSLEDAPFVLKLVNEPSWLQFIGDRGVRNLEDARGYLQNGPLAMYDRHGFGLYRVDLKEDGTPIGMCGLLRRDSLPDVDIGYALFPQFWGCGYAYEAASAVMEYGLKALGLPRIVAIVSPENRSSIRVLEKLGLAFQQKVRMPGATADSDLFAPPS